MFRKGNFKTRNHHQKHTFFARKLDTCNYTHHAKPTAGLCHSRTENDLLSIELRSILTNTVTKQIN